MRESNLEFDRARLLSSIDLISAHCEDGEMAGRITARLNGIMNDIDNVSRPDRDFINMLIRTLTM